MSHTTPECDEMRELLLEADAAELSGAGDSPVALHVRDCRTCAAAALRIINAQQELADALGTLAAAARSLPAVTRGTTEMPGPAAAPARTVTPRSMPVRSVHRTGRFRRRLIATSAPLAAAAVLVLFLLSRDGELPHLETRPQPIAMALANTPVVNVEAGSDVAVMQTSNPNITVVWYLNRERQ